MANSVRPDFTKPIGGEGECFVRETQIATPAGEVRIEDLGIGDLVMTASGESRPVRWLGHSEVECARLPDPSARWPIRIQAGAFAEGKPCRDLYVSRGHALLIDGVLLQAESLINGATVVEMPSERVQLWHLELDSHDIVIAEGLPVESYLDVGNRLAFIEGADFIKAHPHVRPKHWTETCVPLVTNGPVLERARAVLLERATTLGHVMTEDPDVYLLADGHRIDPLRLSPTRLAFTLPPHVTKIELRSRSFVPASINASDDMRRLGICVNRLQLNGLDVPLYDDNTFAVGWYGLEHDASGQWRWSHEQAQLPASARLVVIDLVSIGLYYWLQPPDAALVSGSAPSVSETVILSS
jgi:hypothetical protein